MPPPGLLVDCQTQIAEEIEIFGVLEAVDELNDRGIIAFDGLGDVNFGDVAAFQLLLFETDAGAAQIGFGGDGAEVVFDGGVAIVGGKKRVVVEIIVFLPFSGEILTNAKSPRATSPFNRPACIFKRSRWAVKDSAPSREDCQTW